KLVLFAISPKLGATDAQQRTDNISLQSVHPSQASQATPAQPVHHQCFHLIVGLVRNSNALRANSSGHLAQKRIARLPSRILQRTALFLRQGWYICLAQRAGHAPLRSQIGHKRRVGPASLATQPMVEMSYMQADAWIWTFKRTKAFQDMEQTHRI